MNDITLQIEEIVTMAVLIAIAMMGITVFLMKKLSSRKNINTRDGRRFVVPEGEGMITLRDQEYPLLDISRRGAQVRCDFEVLDENIKFVINGVAGLARIRWRNKAKGVVGIQFMNVRFDDCRKIARYRLG